MPSGKNLEEGTHWELFELLSEIGQTEIVSSSPLFETKTAVAGGGVQKVQIL